MTRQNVGPPYSCGSSWSNAGSPSTRSPLSSLVRACREYGDTCPLVACTCSRSRGNGRASRQSGGTRGCGATASCASERRTPCMSTSMNGMSGALMIIRTRGLLPYLSPRFRQGPATFSMAANHHRSRRPNSIEYPRGSPQPPHWRT